jgi:hypothetical protein
MLPLYRWIKRGLEGLDHMAEALPTITELKPGVSCVQNLQS